MRRITFFIGNGFDINVGLDTRYSDFYTYYLQQNPSDMLVEDILEKSKQKDDEFWSDLEVGLGNYTAQITDNQISSFFDSENAMEEALADYLEMQTERIQISGDMEKEIATLMRESILQFYERLAKEPEQYIRNVIRAVRDSIVYSFISFNYTDAFDRCLQLVKKQYPNIGNHRADNGNVYNHSVGEIIHINGTINAEMILGVNDADQIANEKIRENSLYRQFFIKEEANKRFGQNKIQDTRSIIDSSEVICIYGMSIGITDKMWWEYLAQWLRGGDKRRLIIFAKQDKKMERITKWNLFPSENKVRNKFRDNSGINENEWSKIEGKIFVKFDSDLFDFKITKD